ncbi:hypothetical protein HER10_EVM0005852 [Colletotrichum scovillei]|uniref:Glutathione s-transferase n=1 Tax=Colletotrichum scovillei TaxID=1209932 RepID=A0A9P7U923_9PEZI|nr:uncharacterized protein HER10_EVM0005852 [Colletotrichum scovillei]KAF4779688.1 hypothetical protein HER10_EVM0005852 [Colletotrichum scovillei]KAG7047124.1 glutathione s-transferase [Colletotrichum scovillei]KAG7056961.1 glutathione s-transferase [Colletotrichum scovillei]KAG7066852.1 glutathione s-transferase [Colletotrichum scovillei]
MPRDGSGASDNKVEETHDVIHGAGAIKDPHVDRADKTAPLPEPEKGLAIDGLAASGGSFPKGEGAGQGGRSN